MIYAKCKICRRLGEKLFLKGERCVSPKCAMIRKAYAPGMKAKKRRRNVSEYSRELAEKQKLRNLYNLQETQFRKYAQEILQKRGRTKDTASSLIEKLESRLDNTIFRLGFAPSRSQARQMVSHRHFLVNNKPVNIPSFILKKGDKITLSKTADKKNFYKIMLVSMKNHQPPSWLTLDKNKIQGEIKAKPNLEEAAPPVEISAVFEYYSR